VKTVNQELLPETEYGVPSGNYDGSSETEFSSDRLKGVGYYKTNATSQTIRFTSNDFVGTIVIQGSLDADPDTDTQWFDAYTFPGDSTIDGSTAVTTSYSITLQGNFTWLRAKVQDFTGGTINSVLLTY
jgi:hypothetical protein